MSLLATLAQFGSSSSAVDRVAVGECEDIMGIEFLKYLPERRETPDGGTRAQA